MKQAEVLGRLGPGVVQGQSPTVGSRVALRPEKNITIFKTFWGPLLAAIYIYIYK